MHPCIAWDKVDNPSPQSTLQVLPSFEEYTPPMTYPKEVDKTIGISMEVEPLEHIKREDLGLNTCSHGLFPISREFPSVDEPEPQPLPNLPFLDVNLGDKRGTDPPINPYSPGSFRMEIVEPLTIHTPPSPHVAYLHQNDRKAHLLKDNPGVGVFDERLETASQDTRDAVTIQPMTASEIWRRRQNMDDLKEL
ncbi:hypothetical protein Tco_0418239 [Tanacetum coccineum]